MYFLPCMIDYDLFWNGLSWFIRLVYKVFPINLQCTVTHIQTHHYDTLLIDDCHTTQTSLFSHVGFIGWFCWFKALFYSYELTCVFQKGCFCCVYCAFSFLIRILSYYWWLKTDHLGMCVAELILLPIFWYTSLKSWKEIKSKKSAMCILQFQYFVWHFSLLYYIYRLGFAMYSNIYSLKIFSPVVYF